MSPFATLATLALILAASAVHAQVPTPDHVVILVLENQGFESIIGSDETPYINSLAREGAVFVDSHGVTHPSQPNYLWLFSGSDQGVTTNACPQTFSSENLGHLLITGGWSFAGYSEGLPGEGSIDCAWGPYARKHNPWVNFTNVPTSANKPFTAFPSDYHTLPTVSFVVPNQDNGMHDGSRNQGDTWVREHLDGFVDWALANNSLFVLTFDEDDDTPENHIPTLFVGPMVTPGVYAQTIDHVDVLRTIEDMYGLPYAGASNVATPIADVWNDCGDDVANAGEECGEPGLGCVAGTTCRACACVNETICEASAAFEAPSLVLAADPFLLRLKVEVLLPKPWVGVDPVANGIHVEIDEPVGSGGLEAILPGGSRWRRNQSGTKWRYTDPTGSISGITRVILTDRVRHGDGLEIVVKARHGAMSLPNPSHARMAIVFGTPGECVAVPFNGFPASCSGGSDRLTCR